MTTKALFLICALALPTTSGTMTVRAFLEEYRELQKYMKNIHPGEEFMVIPKILHLIPAGYDRFVIPWRNQTIYIKRTESAA